MNNSTIKTFEFNSLKPGKRLVVFGAIHGTEKCGTKGILKIIKDIENKKIEIISGSVLFIPICNPAAYEEDEYYIEDDPCRVFEKHKKPKSYEEKIANVLTKYIQKGDYFLDLHGYPAHGDSVEFYDKHNNKKKIQFIKAVKVKNLVTGWDEVYDGEYDDDTTTYANKIKATGICVECGSDNSPQAIQNAKKVVLNALSFLRIIQSKMPALKKRNFFVITDRIIKKKDGHLIKKWKNLDPISQNKTIAIYDDGEKIKAKEDCYIIFPGDSEEVGDSWFYLGRKAKPAEKI